MIPDPRTRPLVSLEETDDGWLVLVGGYPHGGKHHKDPNPTVQRASFREAILHHARCANWSGSMYAAWMAERARFPRWGEEKAA